MTWHYNPATMKTDDQAEAPIRRVHVEEAIHRLLAVGITNQLELTRVVAALTGLSTKEARFSVELMCRPIHEGLVDA